MGITEKEYAEVAGLFPEIRQISARDLREKVAEAWLKIWRRSKWNEVEKARHVTDGLATRFTQVEHTRAVTNMALSLAKVIKEIHNVEVNTDYLIAGSILHDADKLLMYEETNGACRHTEYAERFQHGYLPLRVADELGIPDDVLHIILTHTPQSRVMPKTIEAIVLCHADRVDDDVIRAVAGARLLGVIGLKEAF